MVEGLREELSQARVSNNQLLEALEVIFLIFIVILLIGFITATIFVIAVGERAKGEGGGDLVEGGDEL